MEAPDTTVARAHILPPAVALLCAAVALLPLACGGGPAPATGPPPADAASATSAGALGDLQGAPTPPPPSAVDLPAEISVLAPEYHAAYRMLPEGPWALRYIAIQLEALAFDEWWPIYQEWLHEGGSGSVGDGADDVFIYFNEDVAKRLSEASEDDRRWVANLMRVHDAGSAAKFEAGYDRHTRRAALRTFADDEGFVAEFEEIVIRYNAMKAGADEAAVHATLERARALRERALEMASMTFGEWNLASHERAVCVMLMDMVVGEPQGGLCDFDAAVAGAQRRLAQGAPARGEAYFRAYAESVASHDP